MRAKETAEIINQTTRTNIIFDKRLREVNYGILEGIQRTKLSTDVWNIFDKNPEKLNAEHLLNVFTRIKSFFDTLDESKENSFIRHKFSTKIFVNFIDTRIKM